jgi:hypothetical protein
MNDAKNDGRRKSTMLMSVKYLKQDHNVSLERLSCKSLLQRRILQRKRNLIDTWATWSSSLARPTDDLIKYWGILHRYFVTKYLHWDFVRTCIYILPALSFTLFFLMDLSHNINIIVSLTCERLVFTWRFLMTIYCLVVEIKRAETHGLIGYRWHLFNYFY